MHSSTVQFRHDVISGQLVVQTTGSYGINQTHHCSTYSWKVHHHYNKSQSNSDCHNPTPQDL